MPWSCGINSGTSDMTPLVLPLAGLVLVLAQIIYGAQTQSQD